MRAQVVELGLQQSRFAGRGAVVEHDRRAGLVQPAADRRADALGAAGDQHDLAFQAAPFGTSPVE